MGPTVPLRPEAGRFGGGIPARVAALAASGVALLLAAETRQTESLTALVLCGVPMLLALTSAWALWIRDVFMVRAGSIAVMLVITLGSVLDVMIGMPGRGAGTVTPSDVVLAALSLTVCAVLGLDGWLRERGRPGPGK